MSDVKRNASHGKADELTARFANIDRKLDRKHRTKREQKRRTFSWEWQRWRDLRVICLNKWGWLIERNDVADLLHATAQDAGDRLELTARERTLWNITTIGPCDQTPRQRAALRKAKKRDRERARRRPRHDRGIAGGSVHTATGV